MTSSGEVIQVLVVAESGTEKSETPAKMRMRMQFEKLMHAWCQHQELPLESAVFTMADGRVLNLTDTPKTCGWTSDKGLLIIQASPRAGLQPQLAETGCGVLPPKEAAPREVAASAASQPTTDPANVSSSNGQDLAGEAKILVEVVSHGREPTDCHMRPTMPFATGKHDVQKKKRRS